MAGHFKPIGYYTATIYGLKMVTIWLLYGPYTATTLTYGRWPLNSHDTNRLLTDTSTNRPLYGHDTATLLPHDMAITLTYGHFTHGLLADI